MLLLLLITVSAASLTGLILLASSIVNAAIERRQITSDKEAAIKFLALAVAFDWLALFFFWNAYRLLGL